MRVQAIDSHTEGEPTRVILMGGPDLGSGTLAARARRLVEQHDDFRFGSISEPRGNEALVGALLVDPDDPTCDFGVIFYNNVGLIGMCGHGTIGLVATLAHLRRIEPGTIRIDTVAGPVDARLEPDGAVAVRNVPAFRQERARITVPDVGEALVDVAYGGNWFGFLEVSEPIEFADRERWTERAWRVRRALREQGFAGRGGAEIDHIGFFGPSDRADSRNFVLCPGGAYDRSPCGTGTSARLACLAADGRLPPEQVYRQESICGGVFEAWYQLDEEGRVIPTIRGRAHIVAETLLIHAERDPLRWGRR
jgi:4-hydroxyproline epimerase